jgi:hypothetical protein
VYRLVRDAGQKKNRSRLSRARCSKNDDHCAHTLATGGHLDAILYALWRSEQRAAVRALLRCGNTQLVLAVLV